MAVETSPNVTESSNQKFTQNITQEALDSLNKRGQMLEATQEKTELLENVK
jgi:hypothetical protein